MTNKIEMGKRYKNEYGEVRILCVDAPRGQPVVGIDECGDIERWDADGSYLSTNVSRHDLTEIIEPETRTIWVNVYEDSYAAHVSEEKARRHARSDIVAIAVPVTLEFTRD